MAFRKAVKTAAKARVAIVGPSGAGKTYTALTLATALAEGGPVAVVDTERGSASKYADIFSFDVLELDSFHPAQYVKAIREAVEAGYRVIVLDSLTHAWSGRGGILELVNKAGNGTQAWQNVKPIENALIEAMTSATNTPIHVIATIRSKQTIEVERDAGGKVTGVKKLGLQGQQRDDIEYEFDIVMRLDIDSTATIDKSRCQRLKGQVIPQPGPEVGGVILNWLNAGAPAPDPEPTPPTPIKPAARPAPPYADAEIVYTPVDGAAPAPASSPALNWGELRQLTGRAPLRLKSEYEFKAWAARILELPAGSIKSLSALTADAYATLEQVARQAAEASGYDLHDLHPGARAS